VARLELHAGEPVGRGGRAGATVALQVHAEQAELPELGRNPIREGPLLIVLPDPGQEALADVTANGVADQALLVAELSVERKGVGGVKSRGQGSQSNRGGAALRLCGSTKRDRALSAGDRGSSEGPAPRWIHDYRRAR